MYEKKYYDIDPIEILEDEHESIEINLAIEIGCLMVNLLLFAYQ